MRFSDTFLTRHRFFFPLTDGVILVDPEYLKDRKGRTAGVELAQLTIAKDVSKLTLSGRG